MIEFESKFNGDVTSSLNKNQMKKMKWIYVFFSILFSFVGIVVFLLPGIEENDMFFIVFGVIFSLVFGFGFYPLCKYLTQKTQEKLNKSQQVLSDNTIQHFRFDEKYVFVQTSKGDDFVESTKCAYKLLYKVEESENEYFLFISKLLAYVIKKDSIKSGTIEDLNKLFETEMKEKFKKFCK